MDNNINNISDLAKYIYGAMTYKNMFISNESVAMLEDIATDYCITKKTISNLIDTTFNRYRKNPNFDYIAFMYYGLIIRGKETSAKRIKAKDERDY